MTYEIAERPTASTVRRMKAARLKEQGHRCAHCQRPISMASCHLDHIIPFSRGGSNLYGNMQALCEGCNLSKGNRMTREDFARGMVRNQEAALRSPYRIPGRNPKHPIVWRPVTGVVGSLLLGLLLASLLVPGEDAAALALFLLCPAAHLMWWMVKSTLQIHVPTTVDKYVWMVENGHANSGLQTPWLPLPPATSRHDKRVIRDHLVRQGALRAMRESEEYLRSA
jgi:hypothetical protein